MVMFSLQSEKINFYLFIKHPLNIIIKHVLVSGCNIPAVQEAARRTGYGNVTISDGTFEQMIRDAKALAAPGDAVLLSPAAASWGRFSDYEQRGRIFKEIVRAL